MDLFKAIFNDSDTEESGESEEEKEPELADKVGRCCSRLPTFK